MHPFKRTQSQSLLDADAYGSIDQPAKRHCTQIGTSINAQIETSNRENINQIYLDALSDISDEIRFAVKCIDRGAGLEAIKTTLANISRLASTAIEHSQPLKMASRVAASPGIQTTSLLAGSRLAPASNIATVPSSTSRGRVDPSERPSTPILGGNAKPATVPLVSVGIPAKPSVRAAPMTAASRSAGNNPEDQEHVSASAPKRSLKQNNAAKGSTMRGGIHPREQFSRDAPPRAMSTNSRDSGNDLQDRDHHEERLPSNGQLTSSRRHDSYRSGQSESNRGFGPYDSPGPGESDLLIESKHRNSQQIGVGKANVLSGQENYESTSDSRDDIHRPNRDATRLTDPFNSRLTESRRKKTLRRCESPLIGFQFSNGVKPSNLGYIPSLKVATPPASIQSPIEPITLNLTLFEKLGARLGQEATLKVTAAIGYSLQQVNLPDLISGLSLPNLLRIEQRDTAVYLRLLDSTAVQRVVSQCGNHSSVTQVEYQEALDSVTISHPADYVPQVTADTMALYQSGARRMLCTSSFQPEYRRSEAEYDEFVVALKRLWGYFSLVRTRAGKVYIGFEGIESAVEGKKILERKFGNVNLIFANERGSGE